MSFTVFVPCNCRKQNKMNIPPFIDKLEIVNGKFEPKFEFRNDNEFKKNYWRWTFCEHNQAAAEFSMTGLLGWRKTLSEKYGSKFENFRKFLPLSNQWMSSNYDKIKAIQEIQEYNKLENGKYQYRVNQFIALLKTAIEMNEEIYWE